MAVRIEGNVVRGLPGVIGGKLAPVVMALVLVVAAADHGVSIFGPASDAEKRGAGGGEDGGRRGGL